MLGGDPLDRQRDDLLGLAIGVALGALADLADPVRGTGLRFLLEPTDQLRLRLRGGEPRQLLKPTSLLTHEGVEFALSFLELLLAPTEFARPFAGVALLAVDQLELLVELLLALDHATLLALDLFAALAGLDLPGLADLHHFFLPGEERLLLGRLRVALGLRDDALGHLIGGLACRAPSRLLGGATRAPSEHERDRKGDH